MATEAAMDRAFKIALLEELIEYTFIDKSIAWEALSVAGSPFAITTDGNKRLAMVGDADIRSVIAKDTYQASSSRGRSQAAIERVVSNEHLGQVGIDLNIGPLINRNPSQSTISKMTMAHTVGAIVGAVSIDSDENRDQLRLVLQILGLWPEE